MQGSESDTLSAFKSSQPWGEASKTGAREASWRKCCGSEESSRSTEGTRIVPGEKPEGHQEEALGARLGPGRLWDWTLMSRGSAPAPPPGLTLHATEAVGSGVKSSPGSRRQCGRKAGRDADASTEGGTRSNTLFSLN